MPTVRIQEKNYSESIMVLKLKDGQRWNCHRKPCFLVRIYGGEGIRFLLRFRFLWGGLSIAAGARSRKRLNISGGYST